MIVVDHKLYDRIQRVMKSFNSKEGNDILNNRKKTRFENPVTYDNQNTNATIKTS